MRLSAQHAVLALPRAGCPSPLAANLCCLPPFCPLACLLALQDLKKYARAKELLIMDEEIKKARQVVEDVGAPQ
jgi:hypothetical protein